MLPLLLLLLRNERKKGNDLIRYRKQVDFKESSLLFIADLYFHLPFHSGILPSLNGSQLEYCPCFNVYLVEGNRLESFMSSFFKELTLHSTHYVKSQMFVQQDLKYFQSKNASLNQLNQLNLFELKVVFFCGFSCQKKFQILTKSTKTFSSNGQNMDFWNSV